MGKIGSGLLNTQKGTRDSSGFVKTQKVLDIKKVLAKRGIEGDFKSLPKDSVCKLNIIPYKISKNDITTKMIGDFYREPGQYVYSCNVWVHPLNDLGKHVLCRKKNFGKPCAFCDAAEEKWAKWKDGGKSSDDLKAQANANTAKMRSMYNVENLADDLRGKNSFLESSDYIFENELVKAATDCEEGEDGVAFYETDTEEGRIVRFRTGKIPRDPCELFRFVPRKQPISKELLEGVVKFGEFLTIPTEEEISNLFYGGDFEEEKTPEEDEDEDEDEDEVDNTADDDSDDDDSDEDTSGKPSSCPSKKPFGKDFGRLEECDDCPAERECYNAKKKMKS